MNKRSYIGKRDKRPWRETKKDHLRRELLAAALSLFEVKGVESVSVDDVAASVGIAKGTFYLYFKTKNAIFQEIVKNGLGEFLDLISVKDDAGGDAFIELKSLLDNQLAYFENHRPMVHLLLALRNRESKLMPEKIKREFRAKAVGSIDRLIKKGMEQGRFVKGEAKIFASAIYGMLLELMSEAIQTGHPFVSIAGSVMAIIEGGIVKK
jgi:AcrR family transcriptional regulator